jgi:zinc transport system substrate-binding protein
MLAVLMVLALLSLLLYTEYPLGRQAESKAPDKMEKPRIIATLFPQYDFTKQIVKDRAEVELLLPPGAESHTYEPSPADILKIKRADIFVYTGRNMEGWADKIISANKKEKLITIDVSEGIKIIRHEEEGDSDGHHHAFDPHIWTDPNNAIIMTDKILSALSAAYPLEADYFRTNAEEFKSKLKKLDHEFKLAVAAGKRKKIVFGGRNAFAYFLKRYGLESISAIDLCSAQADPGVKRITDIIKEIREEKIPVVFYGDLVVPKIAKTISAETGAKLLPLNSCHNFSDRDLKRGVTYISAMRENLKNLKEGLK